MKDVCKDRLTKEEYNMLRPFYQGYATYMQAEWPEAEIPKTCPYPPGSFNEVNWRMGEKRAYIDVLDTST